MMPRKQSTGSTNSAFLVTLVSIGVMWVASDVGYYFLLPALDQKSNYNAHGISVVDRLMVEHYRPRDRPDAVFIAMEKDGDSYWYPLSDREGHTLFPELIRELDALCKDRIAGHLFLRDGSVKPWYTPKGDRSYLTHEVKKVIRAAGLRDELTFTSFRHGGITEAADSGLTDAEIRAISLHTSSKVLPRYAKKTLEQVAEATSKRRVARTKRGHFSE